MQNNALHKNADYFYIAKRTTVMKLYPKDALKLRKGQIIYRNSDQDFAKVVHRIIRIILCLIPCMLRYATA